MTASRSNASPPAPWSSAHDPVEFGSPDDQRWPPGAIRPAGHGERGAFGGTAPGPGSQSAGGLTAHGGAAAAGGLRARVAIPPGQCAVDRAGWGGDGHDRGGCGRSADPAPLRWHLPQQPAVGDGLLGAGDWPGGDGADPAPALVQPPISDPPAGDGAGQHAQRNLPGTRSLHGRVAQRARSGGDGPCLGGDPLGGLPGGGA